MHDAPPFDPVATGRSILRSAAVGTLATLGETGVPFATLVTVATYPDGRPILSLSDLAVHTANLKRDPRASLLLVAPGGEGGNPLAGARITLTGRIDKVEDETAARRYAALHGGAGGHSSFADFNHYVMTVTGSHLVAGFGRIAQVPPEQLLFDHAGCEDALAGEQRIVEHMNEDHAEAIGLYATRLLGLPEGAWRMTGCDPDGIDLSAGGLRARLDFPARARTVGEAGGYLKTFAKEARAMEGRSLPKE